MKFTTHVILAPRLKDEWSYTSNPPLHLHCVNSDNFTAHGKFSFVLSCSSCFSVYQFPLCTSHFLFVSPIPSYQFYGISLQNYGPAFLNSETYSASEVEHLFSPNFSPMFSFQRNFLTLIYLPLLL